MRRRQDQEDRRDHDRGNPCHQGGRDGLFLNSLIEKYHTNKITLHLQHLALGDNNNILGSGSKSLMASAAEAAARRGEIEVTGQHRPLCESWEEEADKEEEEKRLLSTRYPLHQQQWKDEEGLGWFLRYRYE